MDSHTHKNKSFQDTKVSQEKDTCLKRDSYKKIHGLERWLSG